MAVIDLRGPGSPGENLARIGAAVGRTITAIKDPHKKERKEFADLLKRNPQLVGAFSRLDRRQPGIVGEIFPNLDEDTITAITSAPPDADELAGNLEIPVLTPEAEGGTLTPKDAKTIGEFARAARVRAKPAEIALEPKRVIGAEEVTQEDVTAGVRREVTGLTPGQTAQDAFNTEIFTTADTAFGELNLEEQEVAALRAKLPATFFDADNQRIFEQRKAIAQMQIDAQNLERANERTDAFQRSIGARWTERTKTGTPETWQLFLFTQEMNERGKGLAGGTILPQNQTDIRLMEVARSFSRADQVDKITEEAAVKTQIRALIDRIEETDRDGGMVLDRTVRQSLVEQLNDAFVELNSLTDGRIPIRRAEIPSPAEIPFTDIRTGFGKNRRIVVTDEAGEEIEVGAEGFLPPTREGAPAQAPLELNLETVDASKLSPITRRNLIKIMNGEGTFEELQAFDPASAQMILDARRGR